MRYYLDTNILIFVLLSIDRDENISGKTKKILEDYENVFYTSGIAVFELLHLLKIGKLKKDKKNAPDVDVFKLLKAAGITIIHTTDKHYKHYSTLQTEKEHKDPFDHIIITQAISDKIPLISSDTQFPFYEKQGLKLIFNKR